VRLAGLQCIAGIIMALGHCLEKKSEYNETVHQLFLDFKKLIEEGNIVQYYHKFGVVRLIKWV
jgi:hypothetical protein